MLPDLKFNNTLILQIISDDSSYYVENFKSLKEIERKLNIPYTALVNIYYTCSNKGGGTNKKSSKKHIHRKYATLLKRMRIFDSNSTELMNDEDYFNNLLKI